MAQKSLDTAGMLPFFMALGGVVLVGLLTAHLAIFLYPAVIEPIQLPFGNASLILGAFGCGIYTLMGAALAYFAVKYLDET